MYVAIHVATPELVASDERELRLSKDQRTAQVDDFLLLIALDKCTSAPAPCRPPIGIAKQNSYGTSTTANTEVGVDFTARLALPVPKADGQGGLFDSLLIRWVAPCSEAKSEACRDQPRLFVRYTGTRLADAKSIKPMSW